MSDREELTVGLDQIAPVWLNRQKTIDKVVAWVEKSAPQHCKLVAFSTILPKNSLELSTTACEVQVLSTIETLYLYHRA